MTRVWILFLVLFLLALVAGAVGCKDGELAPAEPVHSAGRLSMELDTANVQKGVDTYFGYALKYPTDDGKLPSSGKYAPIDFYAGFTMGAESLTFYPGIISKLPQHHDEGVWRIDSRGTISVNMNPDDY